MRHERDTNPGLPVPVRVRSLRTQDQYRIRSLCDCVCDRGDDNKIAPSVRLFPFLKKEAQQHKKQQAVFSLRLILMIWGLGLGARHYLLYS